VNAVFQTKLIVVGVSPDVAPILHDDKIDIIHFCQEALNIIIYIYIYIDIYIYSLGNNVNKSKFYSGRN
jgi:hypothetical protein